MSKNGELLFSVTRDDFDVSVARGSGPGGQHRNKTESAVRIVHRASGAAGYSESERSQHTNKKLAFERLLRSAKWRVWLARKIQESLSGETVEQRVDRLMSPGNLRVEVVDEIGRWIKEGTDGHADAP